MPNRFESQPRGLTLKKGAAIASSVILAGSLASIAANVHDASVKRPSTTGYFDMILGDYQSFLVEPGDVLLGDFAVGPVGTSVEQFREDAKAALDPTLPKDPEITQLYDTRPNPKTGVSNRDTGQITVIETSAFAYADGWKGAIEGNIPQDKQSAFVQSRKIAMEQAGCITGCSGGVRVSEVTADGIKPYQPSK